MHESFGTTPFVIIQKIGLEKVSGSLLNVVCFKQFRKDVEGGNTAIPFDLVGELVAFADASGIVALVIVTGICHSDFGIWGFLVMLDSLEAFASWSLFRM